MRGAEPRLAARAPTPQLRCVLVVQKGATTLAECTPNSLANFACERTSGSILPDAHGSGHRNRRRSPHHARRARTVRRVRRRATSTPPHGKRPRASSTGAVTRTSTRGGTIRIARGTTECGRRSPSTASIAGAFTYCTIFRGEFDKADQILLAHDRRVGVVQVSTSPPFRAAPPATAGTHAREG